MYVKKPTEKRKLIKVYFLVTYKNQIHCKKEKQKLIRGVFRNSVKHPRRSLLRKQSTTFNS